MNIAINQSKFRDIGIVAVIAGISSSSIVANDALAIYGNGRYVVQGTDSTGGRLTSYRIDSQATMGVELAAFAQGLASRQVGFDAETASIIARGWDRLFD